MKMYLIFILVLVASVVLFQNCSKEFKPIDNSSEYFSAVNELESNFDKKYLTNLINSEEIVFDSMNLNSYSKNLFFQEATFFIIRKQNFNNSSLNLTVDADQITSLAVESDFVTLTHEAPSYNFSRVRLPLKSATMPLIISGRVGKDPKNILLMINGDFATVPIESKGNPVNYSYLETAIQTLNTDRVIIFNRALEPSEMNVYSRYLGRQYDIQITTSVNTPEFFFWDNSENNQFLFVKSILSQKCFACHNSWSNLKENNYITAGSITNNRILVVPKSLKDSPLWFYK
jgi:hypothetical protein